jgi:hypothetical protein
MFKTGAWKLRASSGFRKPNSFFIGARRQKLSVQRKATLTRISRSGRLKPHAARVYQHHGIVAHSVLSDNTHVAQTSALDLGNSNVPLRPFARLLKALDSLAWVLRSFGILVLGLAMVCCNFTLSFPQAPFLRHVGSITKEHKFHVNNTFFYLYLQVCDFLIGRRTRRVPFISRLEMPTSEVLRYTLS